MEIVTISENGLSYSPKQEETTEKNFCGLCFNKGKRVLRETLANHVKIQYWNEIDGKFYYCNTFDCPVIYFDRTSSTYFAQEDLRTTVMHKQEIGTEYRAACYCKNVLEKTIIDELLVKKCCDSLTDIQKFTEANTGKNCKITNPTGRCCGGQIKNIIQWAQTQHSEISVPLLEEAISCCSKIEANIDAS